MTINSSDFVAKEIKKILPPKVEGLLEWFRPIHWIGSNELFTGGSWYSKFHRPGNGLSKNIFYYINPGFHGVWIAAIKVGTSGGKNKYPGGYPGEIHGEFKEAYVVMHSQSMNNDVSGDGHKKTLEKYRERNNTL